MLEVKDIVNVIINRETTSKTIRDLQTIAVLSQHARFTDVYQRYGSTTDMLDAGFLTTDYAYISASRIFAQNPQVKEIIVGRITPEDTGIDYVAEIVKLQSATEEWFYLITDASDDADKLKIAEYIETQTAVYIFSDSNVATPTSATTDIFSKIAEKSLVQSIGIHVKDSTVVSAESAWVGRFAATQIGGTSWIHKTLVTLIAEGYTRTEYAFMKAKNAHYYTKVGQDSVVEGNANTVGGEKIKTILGAIWLRVRLGERLWNLLYSKENINYTNEGIELFKAEIVAVLNEAVANNILTDEDGFSIQTPDASKLTSQERASGYLRKITFRARLAGAILFVDAITGTVYA